MLQDQEAVVVLLQDSHELEGCEGSPDPPLHEVAIQSIQGLE